MMATIEQGEMMQAEYRFTRQGATWAITTPAADGWRQMDGHISTHLRGRLVVVTLHGADALLTADVQQAWAMWWQAQYGG